MSVPTRGAKIAFLVTCASFHFWEASTLLALEDRVNALAVSVVPGTSPAEIDRLTDWVVAMEETSGLFSVEERAALPIARVIAEIPARVSKEEAL